MGNSRHTLGGRGEALAVEYLQRRGYRILERNWRSTVGELDVIAQQDDTLVFVEVRARFDANTEAALASITPRKREKTLRAVHAYLEAHACPDDTLWRIDAIAVAFRHAAPPHIDHVENALDW